MAYASCLTEANQGGSALVKRYLARIYAEGHYDGTVRDRDAIYWFRMAAEGGDTFSQMEMARRYENGSGVPRDATKATQMYLAAAYAGVTEAYAVLGRRFEDGVGTPESESQAARPSCR